MVAVADVVADVVVVGVVVGVGVAVGVAVVVAVVVGVGVVVVVAVAVAVTYVPQLPATTCGACNLRPADWHSGHGPDLCMGCLLLESTKEVRWNRGRDVR